MSLLLPPTSSLVTRWLGTGLPALLMFCVTTTGGETVRVNPIPGQTAGPPAGVPRLDPTASGWDSEVFAEAAAAQLGVISGALESGRPPDAAALSSLVLADAVFAPLLPTRLDEVLRDGPLVVSRSRPSSATGTPAGAGGGKGAEGLARALGELFRPLQGSRGIRAEVQVIDVDAKPDSATAILWLHAGGITAAGTFEQTAMLRSSWTRPAGGTPPRLKSLQTQQYEQVAGGRGAPMFADATRAVLGRNRSFTDDLVYGVDHWLERLESWIETDSFGHHGIAVGDVNGDGLDDIYVCQMGGLPNLLFVQNADGTATDVSAQAGVDWLERTRSALLLDLDNDGDQDLVVATSAALLFMENDGKGRFTVKASLTAAEGMVTAGAAPSAVRTGGLPDEGMAAGHYQRSGDFGAVRTSDIVSLAAADYDNDGFLDIYACAYHAAGEEADRFPIPVPYHDANNGGRNLLIRNEGGWRFTDATKQTGLDVNNTRFSFAASWEDFDDDGDQDLYVANDFGRNNLYRNDGGRFTDIAAQAGVEDIAAGMSASWGDYDHDGRMDLYVGNMFSAAGSRIAKQEKFQRGADAATLAAYRHHAMGNTLYRNAGGGKFEDVSAAAAVTMGRWSWSSNFVDLDNDGWQDLLVADGYFTRPDPRDLSGFFWREVVGRSPVTRVEPATSPDYSRGWGDLGRMIRRGFSFAGRERNVVFLNTGGPAFANVSATSGLDFLDDARAVAVTDWDGDGALDVWIANRTGPRLRFARNQAAAGRHWLELRLEGRSSNRDAIGARIELKGGAPASGRRVTTLRAGDGYLAQSSKWVHFGLGDAAPVLTAVVRWPSGKTEEFAGVGADRRYRLVEGTGKPQEDAAPLRRVTLAASDLESPPEDERARILLSAPVPAPSLEYETFDWRTVAPAGSGPLLVYLWSTADPTSVGQLSEIARRANDLKAAGLRVAALSVDGVDKDQPPDSAPAQRILSSASFPFETGYAYPDLIAKLTLLQQRVLWIPRPYPLPTSLLVDGDGLLAAIYKGPLPIDQLLADLPALRTTGEKRLSLAIPFAGMRQTRGMPSMFDYMDSIAQTYSDGGYPDEAAAYFRKVLRIQPGRAPAHFGLAVALAGLNQDDESIAEYRRTLEIDPNHVSAMTNLGFTLSGQGKKDEAIPMLRKALDLEPDNVQTLCNLGAALADLDQPDEAIALYRRALAVLPDDTLALNNLAVALARQGKDDEAIASYRRVLQVEPDNLPAHLNLAAALIRKGQSAEAAELLSLTVKQLPAQPEARYTLGLALSRLGRTSEAVTQFSEAARLKPGYSQARYQLAIALARDGRVDEAVRTFAEVMKLPAGSPEAHARLAWILATSPDPSLRDGAQSIQLARRACEATGNQQTVALDALAAAYAEAGRFPEAVQTAKKALDLLAARGDAAAAEPLKARLALYEARKPYRDAGGGR